MQNKKYFQLSLSLIKLCRINVGHLVNLYISLEKRENATSLQQFDRSPQNLT